MRYFRLFFGGLLLILIAKGACMAQDNDPYTYKTPDRDGTGKVYKGREISKIMSFHGVNWLERPSRSREENTDEAIANLPLEPDHQVADIGAGSGFYTFRIAKRVPEGKVYAVEVQEEALIYLKDKAEELGVTNVEATKGDEKTPNLSNNALDMVIMVDVYHELLYPHEMLAAIKKSLKTDGKLVLIEYRGEDPEVAIKPLHKMTLAQIEKEMKANGFHLAEKGDFMHMQHFLVYQKGE
ncbi:class I SAM-dependent methyltransferase [Pleomorphovibrio marinus]|uniref:class I SAM-dependent methyltransferase n=1 Tax=Pleomorphovibrio marinus TaxID=2164132 RepID=UPI000E0BA47A|nr:class I SAM-dependent methyltransferase [Pleomorphovibrio marinus]